MHGRQCQVLYHHQPEFAGSLMHCMLLKPDLIASASHPVSLLVTDAAVTEENHRNTQSTVMLRLPLAVVVSSQ